MRKSVILNIAVATIALASATFFYAQYQTSQHLISLHHQATETGLIANPSWQPPTTLPAPVLRYFNFTFPDKIPRAAVIKVEMSGEFRRPQQDTFSFTTARQTLTPATPAMVFEARTPVFSNIWALAYDAYLNGQMEMKAKILSALTIMEQPATPELDRISLRRWLLEAPLYPQALLPSRYVRWEAIDNNHARVIARYKGLTTSLIADIDAQGKLKSLRAENDGDLTTPYHGSGEYAARSDYRMINGMMIPHKFSIARHAKGTDYPFWHGEINDYQISYYP